MPTPIPFVEIYTAVQTGVVDGADVGMADILAVKFYEVARYMSLTRHVYIAVPLYVSRRFLATLTPHDRDVVRETGLKIIDIMQDSVKQQDTEGLDFLRKAGMEITEDVDDNAGSPPCRRQFA